MAAEDGEDVGPEVVRGARLGRQEIFIETRRATHGLAGVVDYEVESLKRVLDVAGKDLDARRMPQVEAMNVKAVFPFREIGLA